jgi:hypothetical protein
LIEQTCLKPGGIGILVNVPKKILLQYMGPPTLVDFCTNI